MSRSPTLCSQKGAKGGQGADVSMVESLEVFFLLKSMDRPPCIVARYKHLEWKKSLYQTVFFFIKTKTSRSEGLQKTFCYRDSLKLRNNDLPLLVNRRQPISLPSREKEKESQRPPSPIIYKRQTTSPRSKENLKDLEDLSLFSLLQKKKKKKELVYCHKSKLKEFHL